MTMGATVSSGIPMTQSTSFTGKNTFGLSTPAKKPLGPSKARASAVHMSAANTYGFTASPAGNITHHNFSRSKTIM